MVPNLNSNTAGFYIHVLRMEDILAALDIALANSIEHPVKGIRLLLAGELHISVHTPEQLYTTFLLVVNKSPWYKHNLRKYLTMVPNITVVNKSPGALGDNRLRITVQEFRAP